MSKTDAILKSLGVSPLSPKCVALLPLVEVAWADGEVQVEERDAILAAADARYHLDDDGQLLLETWLTHRPTDDYLRRGREALVALSREQRLGLAVEDADVARHVIQDAEAVAKAAGGWFGFRAVEPREQEALASIASAFETIHAQAAVSAFDQAHTWDDTDDRTDPGGATDPLGDHLVDLTSPEQVPTVAGPSLFDAETERVYPVADRLGIGRHGTNGVVLSSDHRVSRNHAELTDVDGRLVVRDLGSANGTRVDGERIVARRLWGQEVLSIGGSRFIVLGV